MFLNQISGSFEVTVNDTLIFSKLERKAFPDFDKVVEAVIAAEGGGSPKTVEDVQKSSCCLV